MLSSATFVWRFNLLDTLCLLLLASIPLPSSAIPVDNGVEGEPEIECGPTSVAVSFNTRNPFEGHVYVKGLFGQAGCRTDGNGQQRSGSIALPFDSCNVKRIRSLNPRGIFVTVPVIISFHPHFETKVDKAYNFQCFYMEADKTVSTELEVSGLTTAFQTENVPMPVCRYQILSGPNGQPISFAIVGQPVFHKWTCDTETVNTFCMRVYGCFVDDGKGDKVDLLDEKGCAIDKYLLNNLEYPTDLMAGKEAHVFKYADRVALFFQCQIEITIKDAGTQCEHPHCPEPAKGRRRRKAGMSSSEGAASRAGAVIDVTAEITAVEVVESNQSSGARREAENRLADLRSRDAPSSSLTSDEICLSNLGFGIFVSFIVILIITATAVVLLACLRKETNVKYA